MPLPANLAAELATAPVSAGLAGLIPTGTRAIVTGQQPAYGGGPLYTLIKTAQAVATARQLTTQGRPTVAVHWVASEDHDLGEAGHVDLLHRDGRCQRVHVDLGPGRASLRHRSATSGWDQLLETVARVDGPGLGTDFWRQHRPRPGESWGAWQRRWLHAVFPDLITVEPHELRVAAAPRLQTVIQAWDRLVPALREAGWETCFGAPEQPPLFADDPEGRRPVGRDEALHLLATAPARVSTGAGLRPVLQQLALPVVASVVGPGEEAYHQVLGPLFAAAEVPPPRLLRRTTMMLAPSWYLRGCQAWGVEPSRPGASTQHRTEPLPAVLTSLELAIAACGEAREWAGLQRRLARMLHQARRRHDNRTHPVPLGVLQGWNRPREQPQDRTMSCVQALWFWGPGLARVLVEQAWAPSPVVVTPTG